MGTLLGEFAVAVLGIVAQQTDATEHILSQRRKFAEAVGLGEDGVGVGIILMFVEVIGTWATIMIDVERFLACGRRGVLIGFIDGTGIEHASRTVDVGLYLLGNLRLRLYRHSY